MKKTFLLILAFCFLTLVLHAQVNKYHPFPDTNAVWRVDHQSGSDCYLGPPFYSALLEQYQYTLGGDTTINSYTYKKVYRSGNYGICSGHPNYFYGYEGALRQDTTNKKVYFKYPTFNDTLLYDFTLRVGDTANTISQAGVTYYSKVTSIDSVLVGNNYHKRFNLNTNNGAIVEGVGSIFGLLEATYMINTFEDIWSLICFSYNADKYPSTIASCSLITNTTDITKFLNQEQINIYPNPANSIINVSLQQIETSNNEIQIINLLGDIVRKITVSNSLLSIDVSNLEPGIYNISITNSVNTINKKLVIVK